MQGKISVVFGVKIVGGKVLDQSKTHSKEQHLTDFYYSFDYNEFGLGKCPHIGYKTILIVQNGDELLKNVSVYSLVNESYEEVGKTDENGEYISISSGNSSLTSAEIHYNSYMPESSGSSYTNSSADTVSSRISASDTALKITINSKSANNKYTGLVANGRYIFMLVRNENAENLIASDNLVDINQFTADENGILKVDYPNSYGDEYTALIFGGRTTENHDVETPDEPEPIDDDTLNKEKAAKADINGDGKVSLKSLFSIFTLQRTRCIIE